MTEVLSNSSKLPPVFASSYVKNSKFSLQITLYLLVKQKENLILHQVSLRALFCGPLQLTSYMKPMFTKTVGVIEGLRARSSQVTI